MAVYNFSNSSPPTTLDGAINGTIATLDVISASGYPGVPFKIRIGAEVIEVGAKSGETFSSLLRGHDATANVAHGDGDPVEHVVTAEDIMPRFDRSANQYVFDKDVRIDTTTPLTLGGAGDTQLRWVEGTNDYRVQIGDNANDFTRRMQFTSADHASPNEISFHDGDNDAIVTFLWDDTGKIWIFDTDLSMNVNSKIMDVEDPTAGNHVGDRDYNDARYVLQ